MSRHIIGMPMLLSVVPLHLLGHNDQNEMKHDSLYIWCHWHQGWHHMVWMASKMTFYFLGLDNWNKVQLGHVMSLVLVSASLDADGIINSTIPFLMSKWLKWVAAWILIMCCHWHWNKQCVMLMALSKAPLHSLCPDDQYEMQNDFFVLYCHWYQC